VPQARGRGKKVCKKVKKQLQSDRTGAIIYKYDCDRYALKREVAALCAGYFRGVCPILNRANNIWAARQCVSAASVRTFLEPTPGFSVRKEIRIFHAG
jgi:hypothetical protein